METIIFLIIVLTIFEIAAMRWGFNSIDGFASSEWERRHHWPLKDDECQPCA